VLLHTEREALELFLCAGLDKRKWNFMKAKEFDKKFDLGDDISESLDLSKAKRVMQDQKRVNVDFPAWMLESLDKEASRVGVTRQSIIKIWLAERLEQLAANKALQRTSQ
jgi:predicted DNA binding CopG/RHH family protein